jgi:hypothetical protein
MQTIENRTISGESLVMDDKHFVNCKVRQSTLIYSGGDYACTNTQFENCQIQLSGPAGKTAVFLGSFGLVTPGPGGPQMVPPPKSSPN